MNNNMDTEDIKSFIIKKDEDYILENNKALDTRLQGHYNIKNELLYAPDNFNSARSIEFGTQIDPHMLNTPVKMEPIVDTLAKLHTSVDNSHCSVQKLPVKQEVSPKIANAITHKEFSSHFISQQTLTSDLEAKPFTPYCDISIKQEVDDINTENLDIKNESIDINNDGEMIQMENGCTNSGCSSQTQCLHTYRCSKCNLVFTEKKIFATHLQKCRLNTNSLTVPSNNITSASQCEHNNLKKLIESIRSNPPLYDINNEDYNDVQLKEVIWANIACNCGFANDALAKAAWKKLKENFRDALTQQNNGLSHQTLIHKFKYQKQMEFLLPYISNNIPNEDNPTDIQIIPNMNSIEQPEDDDDDISIIQQLVSPAKKQKLLPTVNETLNVINTNKRNRDGRSKNHINSLKEPNVRSSASTQPLHMFFLSMCETTKNLPPHLQLQVKRRVFQAVIEAEEAAATLNNDSTSNNNTPRTSLSSRDQVLTQFSLNSLTNVIDNSSSSSQED